MDIPDDEVLGDETQSVDELVRKVSNILDPSDKENKNFNMLTEDEKIDYRF